jgi:hypothetical protein
MQPWVVHHTIKKWVRYRFYGRGLMYVVLVYVLQLDWIDTSIVFHVSSSLPRMEDPILNLLQDPRINPDCIDSTMRIKMWIYSNTPLTRMEFQVIYNHLQDLSN